MPSPRRPVASPTYTFRVRIRDAPAGKELLFLFDYGDEWHFGVRLVRTGKAPAPGVRYPKVVASHGQAPPQYPIVEDDWDEEADGDEELLAQWEQAEAEAVEVLGQALPAHARAPLPARDLAAACQRLGADSGAGPSLGSRPRHHLTGPAAAPSARPPAFSPSGAARARHATLRFTFPDSSNAVAGPFRQVGGLTAAGGRLARCSGRAGGARRGPRRVRRRGRPLGRRPGPFARTGRR